MGISSLFLISCLGFFIAILVYWLVNTIFPPPGLGEGTYHHDEDSLVLPSAIHQDRPSQGQYATVLDGMEVSNSTREAQASFTEGKALDTEIQAV